MLRDIANVDTSVTLLGSKHPTPIMVAPTGRHKLFNPEGERATARGAAAASVPYVMATNANVTIEDVAAERKSAPQWFQLYYWPNRAEVEALIDRLAAAGFGALVLTVDAPVPGWSPRAARLQHEPSPDIRNINMPGSPMARTAYHPDFVGKVMYPATWRELEWLVKRSPMPVMVKGVLRADDAVRCAECGARAIIVSNHGGRHLDTTVTTAAAIGEVASALAGKGRSLCRWRHPARHRYPQGARARRPRRADRPADHLGLERARRRRRQGCARASAHRTGARDAALRRRKPQRSHVRPVGARHLIFRT